MLTKNSLFTPLPSPKLNILIRVGYHEASYCKVSIESILYQTYRKFNIIIGYNDERTHQYLNAYWSYPNIIFFKCNNYNNINDNIFKQLEKGNNNWIIVLEVNDKLVNDSVLDQIRHRANKPNDIIFWNVLNDTNTVDQSRTYGQCFHVSYKQNFYNNGKSVVEGEYIKRLSTSHNFKIKLINSVLIYNQSTTYNTSIEKKNDFSTNMKLKDYIITILGYTKIKLDGSRHTNWFPWNRFLDVFNTIGYKCEWTELHTLERGDEKRLFITWNEPTSLDLYQSGKVKQYDIVFQKLTSLGKGMNDVNWTKNSHNWNKEWHWPIYKTVEYLYDKGLNIYGFGCKTQYNEYPEKKRICEKLKDRIFWITWGGTPFNWNQIKQARPVMSNLIDDIAFVGSKWGKVGRGNVDSWDKYIKPLKNCKYNFNQYGGIGNKMVSDGEMVEILQKSKICPIIHAPSWQSERGIQDRFYTVFLSGRFGICDNLGAIDIMGEEIREICTEDPQEYYNKTLYYLENPDKQLHFINIIQDKIKKKYNFYRQWESVFNSDKIKFTINRNWDLITNINYGFIPTRQIKNIPYQNEDINSYFDKIFIVNLKSDIHKRLKMLELLDNNNITNYEFIDAINGSDAKYDDIFSNKQHISMWEKKNKKKHISKRGEIGCLLSHLTILEISKSRGYTKWLHLEDDVIMHKNMNALFKTSISETPADWDVIYLGTTQAYWRENYNIEFINKNIYKANISCGTFGFAVSNTNLDFIINKYKMHLYPADATLTAEVQNILNCYVIKPNLVVARLNDSCIRDNYGLVQELQKYEKYNWNKNDYDFLNGMNTKNMFRNDKIKHKYNLLSNTLTSEEEFKTYVRNKKIAIIGPAPSVKDTENGQFIESEYDIIIRINKQWQHSHELDKYIGKRTDILYNCLDYRDDCGGELDIDYLKNNIHFLVCPIKYDFLNKMHRDSQFHGKSFLHWYNYFHVKNNKNNKNKLKFIHINSELYDHYDNASQTRVNTGLMAIFHILEYDIQELYISGFTFFLDGYLLNYRDNINGKKCTSEKETKEQVVDFMIKKNKNHNQENQWRLFKTVYEEKRKSINIVLDEKLSKIVNYENFPKI